MATPPAKQFKCTHKDCVFRNMEHYPHFGCDYAAMTGRTRTRRDKPADTLNCDYYVKKVNAPRRRGYSLTGPVWEQVAVSLHYAGYSTDEIARIVSAAPDAVAKCLERIKKPKTARPKGFLSGYNFDKARELYEQGMSDYKIAEALGCSKTRVRHWREAHGLPTKQTKGKVVQGMKAVLMSIRPEWCNEIFFGAKRVEIRKTFPKIPAPFAVYVYCTKNSGLESDIDFFIPYVEGKTNSVRGNGFVVGEFVCDGFWPYLFENGAYKIPQHVKMTSGLSDTELLEYGDGKTLFAWFISHVKAYEEPRPVETFFKAGKCPYNTLEGCTYHLHCFRAGEKVRCGETLTRAPQSWCYVETLE